MSEVDKELQEYMDEVQIEEQWTPTILVADFTIKMKFEVDPDKNQAKAIRNELYRFTKKVIDILEG